MHKELLKAALVVLVLGTGVVIEGYESYSDWRVVGGQIAPNKSFPYQVALKTTSGTFFCGGFVYTKRTVITSASCVTDLYPSRYLVLAGTNQLTINGGGESYHVSRHLMHPQWDPRYVWNDIALVFLGDDIDFTDAIQPIALETNEIGAGVDVALSGWGRLSTGGTRPTNLYYVNLTTIANEECNSRLVQVLSTVHDSNICTFTKRDEGVCGGDHGGALTHQGKAVGILSWITPCAVGLPDIYTRINWYAAWIKLNANY